MTKPIRLLPSMMGQKDWSIKSGRKLEETPEEAQLLENVQSASSSPPLALKEAWGLQLFAITRA